MLVPFDKYCTTVFWQLGTPFSDSGADGSGSRKSAGVSIRPTATTTTTTTTTTQDLAREKKLTQRWVGDSPSRLLTTR